MAIKIGVLSGGPSDEHEVSLKSGEAVLNYLPEHYQAENIYINPQAVWHLGEVPYEPHKILPRFDVIFNALHGTYGEDGRVQKVLRGFPFTGPASVSAALAMDKCAAKELMEREYGTQVPLHYKVRYGEHTEAAAEEIMALLGLPVIIKPNAGGSSVGVVLARTTEELVNGLNDALERSSVIVAEQYLMGREATCAVVEGLRGEDLYALPPVEIQPPVERPFFDYSSKYDGISQEICPGRFSPEEKLTLQETAKAAHRVLGLRHYSRTDFIVHPRQGIYYLETNSLPGITPSSLLPPSLDAVGVTMSEFLEHVVKLALSQRSRHEL